MIDGGIEAGATEEPYRIGPHDDVGAECCVPTEWRGALLQSPDKIVELMDAVIRMGWRVGTHAYGDRGVRTLLDVYETLLQRHPHLPPGTLVMEHGGLATADQRKGLLIVEFLSPFSSHSSTMSPPYRLSIGEKSAPPISSQLGNGLIRAL